MCSNRERTAASGYSCYPAMERLDPNRGWGGEHLRAKKRAQTSRVKDTDNGDYRNYGSVSRGQELAFILHSRNPGTQGPRPSTSSSANQQKPPDTTCQEGKTLDQPRINSSRYEAEAIQHAIADLANVPQEVERAIRSGVSAPGGKSKESQQMFREATRKLNIQPSTKVYRDLLDIDVTPEVNLKRNPLKPKKIDPVPVLEDYMQVQYNKVKPYNFSLTIKRKDESYTSSTITCLNDDNANDYDLIRLERMFISQ